MEEAIPRAEFEPYNLARWLTRNEHDAADMVQEAYLRAYRFFHTFDPARGDGKAWLLGIVRNTCFTWSKRRTAHPSVEIDEERMPTETAGPHLLVVEQERAQAVAGCIAELPEEYRGVIVMREMEELSYQQIADAAGLAIGTVMSRLSRARKRLKDCLAVRLGIVPAGAGAGAL